MGTGGQPNNPQQRDGTREKSVGAFCEFVLYMISWTIPIAVDV